MVEVNENQAPDVEMNANVSADPAPDAPEDKEESKPVAENTEDKTPEAAEDAKKDGEDTEMKEGDAEEKKEEEVAKEPEKPKELELDAEEDTRAKITTPLLCNEYDSTLNSLVSEGEVLTCLSSEGFGHLLAGIRANQGVKSGRYYFEIKCIETVNNHHRQSRSVPTTVINVGFSTLEGDCLFGQSHTVGFNQEGDFLNGTKSARGKAKKFSLNSAVGILLNLVEGHENFNTISMFREGIRVSEPMKLPEELHGKTLYPIVNYKNASVVCNFGQAPIWKELPFKVTQIAKAAAEDCETSTFLRPTEGKYEVVLPVATPEKGGYDWLDTFMAENRGKYTELSNRELVRWAKLTGHTCHDSKGTVDEPDMGLQNIDDLQKFTILNTLKMLAALKKRNYVCMSVNENLLKAKRAELLSTFGADCYEVVAKVIVGEPTAEFVTAQREKELVSITEKAERDHTRAEDKRKREHDMEMKARERKMNSRRRQLEREQNKKKADEEKAATETKADEPEKKADDAEMKETTETSEEKKPEGEDKPAENSEENKDEEATEEKKTEEATEEKKDEEKPAEEKNDEKSIDELLLEEFPELPAFEPQEMSAVEVPADLKFRNDSQRHVLHRVVDQNFIDYCMPSEDEGFARREFLWSDEAACVKAIERYVYEKKIVAMLTEYRPAEWAKTETSKWGDQRLEWRNNAKKWTEKLAEAEKARADESKKDEDKAVKEGEEAAAEKKEGEEAEAEKKEGEEADAEKKDDAEMAEEDAADKKELLELVEPDMMDFANTFDPFSTEEIDNVNSQGMPLYVKFASEDWTLCSLRFDVHIMLTAFKKEVEAAKRPGIHKSLFDRYYKLFINKDFYPENFGCKDMETFFEAMKDTFSVDEDGLLCPELDEEIAFGTFVRLTEQARRIRQQKIDLGDESAKLVFKDLKRGRNDDRRSDRPRDSRGGKGKGYGKGRRDDRRGGGYDSRSSKGGGKGYNRDDSRYGRSDSGGYSGRNAAPPARAERGSYGTGGPRYGQSAYGGGGGSKGQSRGGGNSYGSYPASGQKRGADDRGDHRGDDKRRNYGNAGPQRSGGYGYGR